MKNGPGTPYSTQFLKSGVSGNLLISGKQEQFFPDFRKSRTFSYPSIPEFRKNLFYSSFPEIKRIS
jgi:hypothetical protein